jgi:transcriptional regulator with XRE-family HTH domain
MMTCREASVADAGHSVFWEDLSHDLEDPQFLREYVAQSVRIATIGRIVNELDAAREVAGLSKAELARAINSEPATVRRLFSAGHVNPTLGTLAEVAAALGLRVVLEPLEDGDRERITGSLLEGSTDDPQVLARRLDAMRRKPDAESATVLPARSSGQGARVPAQRSTKARSRRPPAGAVPDEVRCPVACQQDSLSDGTPGSFLHGEPQPVVGLGCT